MNLILLHPSDFVSEEVAVVRNRRHEHLTRVLRVAAGDEVSVGVVNGKIGVAAVVRVDQSECELAVDLTGDPPPPLPVTLVVALPRPKVLNRVVASAASLGVKKLWLLNAWKVEKSYWKSPRLQPENLMLQSLLGLEQAMDTMLPGIQTARFFRAFVEAELPRIAADSLRLFAHPLASEMAPRQLSQRATIVVGPEGGFIPEEVASLEQAGFGGISLGPRVLRTETAIAALLGRFL